jgi:hypothetical protein
MAKAQSGSKDESAGRSPSQLIDARIKELGDWRGETLAQIRKLIKDAVPDVIEEWKWRGVPTWYRDGMICTVETYKNAVKITFAKGAALEYPSGLSTPAWAATPGVPSIFTRTTRSTARR